MSTAAPPTAASPRPQRAPARIWWATAGSVSLGALGVAEVVPGDSARFPAVVVLLLVTMVLVAGAMQSGLRSLVGAGGRLRFLRSVGLVVGVIAAVALLARWLGVEFTLIGLSLFGGIALIAQWLVGVVERADDDVTPWQTMSRGEQPTARLGAGWRGVGALVGAGLLVFVTFDLVANHQVQNFVGLDGLAGNVVGLVALAGLVLVLTGPLLLSAQVGARRTRRIRERASERQAVAAHLHDSVLQTLAMIQRSAADPERVAQLARRQERGLRAWLAGRDETQPPTLAAALEAVAQEVEDESGLAIECVLAGDLPVDDRTVALAQAARETLRNATEHGGSGVRLVLDVDGAGASVFVRDSGAGFDPDRVPDERRGVRDAIIGRMHAIGGTVTIESGSGGTEVVLHLPLRGSKS